MGHHGGFIAEPRRRFLLGTAGLVTAAVVATACGAPPPSPSAAPTLVPAKTATPSFPATEQAAASSTPAGLAPQGPYVLFASGYRNGGVWIANADGSYPTQIAGEWLGVFDLHRALSPTGDRLAIVTGNDEGYDLNEILLPQGQTRQLAHLMSITPDEQEVRWSDEAIVAMMISSYDNVAWQPPAGRWLAFVAAINGPTADIYVVDTTSGEIRQLTNGPSQAIIPSWSPDGEYIHHFGVSLVLSFEWLGEGYNRIDGVWAVRASDGQMVTQPWLLPSAFGGWADERRYWMNGDDGRIASVDVATGEAREVLTAFCPAVLDAQSAVGGTRLLSVLPETDCPSGSGVYLWGPAEADEPVLLDSGEGWDSRWLEESGVFNVDPIALFSGDGSRRFDPPTANNSSFNPAWSSNPAISRAGYEAWEVLKATHGRVVVRAPGGDWKQVLETNVADMIWDPLTGETLLIAGLDGTLYAATAPDFVPRVTGQLGEGVDQAIWVP